MTSLPLMDLGVLVHHELLRAQELEARYPDLLSGPWGRKDGVLYHRIREGSQLVTVALQHDALLPKQRRALGAFRVRQYALCGLYDIHRAMRGHLPIDPSLEMLAPTAFHILAGTPDGRLLAYMCMETARYPGERDPVLGTQEPEGAPDSARVHTMDAPERPLFPTESELFGLDVFPSLPAVRRLAVIQIRELSRMMRNQVVQSPQSVAAAIEVIYAASRLAIDPALNIKAMIGCLDGEGRRMISQVGIPILYAPLVPVLPQQVSLTMASPSAYWTDPANAQGRFWPFVIATDDVEMQASHFRHMDAMLSLSMGELRRALVAFRKQSHQIRPQAFVLLPGESAVLWTAKPLLPAQNGRRSPVAQSEPAVTAGRKEARETEVDSDA